MRDRQHNGGWVWAANAAAWLFDAAFLLSLLIVPGAWLMTPLRIAGWSIPWSKSLLAVPVVLLAARFGARRLAPASRALFETRVFKNICLSLASTFVFFLLVEQGFEWAKFEAHTPPIIIRGETGDDVSSTKALVRDRELRWRFQPGVEWRGRRVNNLGFLDREVEERKTPGTIRVICMGDSVTGQGIPPYSGHLHRMLAEDPPTDSPWEAFNMGVHGYSSVQGLRLFEKQGRGLDPDIVTLYFGWNDHWRGGRKPDSARLAVDMTPARAAVYRVLRKKRFGQYLLFRFSSEREQISEKEAVTLRVPADEYRRTLSRFIDEIRAAGGVPLLITAPRTSALTPSLVKNGQAESLIAAKDRHDQYVAITREVAEERGAQVLDFAAILDAEDKSPWMSADGIHLTDAGLERLAREIHAKLGQVVKSDEWRRRAGPDA